MVVAHGFGEWADELLKEALHSIHRRDVKVLVDLGLVLLGERVNGILSLTPTATADDDLEDLPRNQLLKV